MTSTIFGGLPKSSYPSYLNGFGGIGAGSKVGTFIFGFEKNGSTSFTSNILL